LVHAAKKDTPIDPEERNHDKFDLDTSWFGMQGKACDAPDAEAAAKRYGR
jgi:hypothetical protein